MSRALYLYRMNDFENQSTDASPWASRRKSIYLTILVLTLTSISFFTFWKFWYKAPTCFDKVKNGDETGIDCGGSCTLVCSDSIIKPIVKWDPRLFEISDNVWSVLAYVENPNINAEATYLPYTFTIYDQNNQVLVERKGATILPKNKTVGIFEGSITPSGSRKPRRAVFEIGNDIIWEKVKNSDEKISITHSSILRLSTTPRIEANVKNEGTKEVKNIELVAAVFDGSDNVIAASRTFVESIKKDQSASVFFTWPKPFELGSKACEKHSNVMLLLDRSGSMASLSVNPPQPLTEAKEAATSFVERLGAKDRAGIISFATAAKEPIDAILSSDASSTEQAINSINIEQDSTQYTNIYDAVHAAWQELISTRADEEFAKIIVLLTDGVANNPRNPNGKTETDDIKYAEDLAAKEASSAKKDGVIIYTIGLGNKVNEAFLKSLASEDKNYFFAPSAENLETIYKNISTDICKEVPARVEITYKIFGSSI